MIAHWFAQEIFYGFVSDLSDLKISSLKKQQHLLIYLVIVQKSPSPNNSELSSDSRGQILWEAQSLPNFSPALLKILIHLRKC